MGFDLRESDVAARINFATLSPEGTITDRRAGRISSEENERLCKILNEGITTGAGMEVFFETEKEHRAAMILRGKGLCGNISDTDPQREGQKPLRAVALQPDSETAAAQIRAIVEQALRLLSEEALANAILLRGFDRYRKIPSMNERYGVDGLAIACYPMYQGISRLVGMTIYPTPQSIDQEIEALGESFDAHDFFFIHFKDTDSRGEDRDFNAKVEAIERLDALVPKILQLSPDVVAVTGDHSTPAVYGSHSWHPVPVLLYSKFGRTGTTARFDEYHCAQGMLGRIPGSLLMGLLLANAGRLKKYGA